MSTNRSSGSLSSMSKLSTSLPIGNSVYDKVYRAIEFLSTDPHQEVSGMSQTLVIFLRQKVKSKDALSRPSLSIPAPLFNEALSAVSTTSEPSSPAKHSTPPPSGSDQHFHTCAHGRTYPHVRMWSAVRHFWNF